MKRFLSMTVLSFSLLASAAMAASVPDLAAQTAADYRQLARYPEWASPLPAGAASPLAAEREPAVLSRPGPGGANPALSVWASDVRYEAGDQVTLYARLADRPLRDADILTAPAPRAEGPWSVAAELKTAAGDMLGRLTLNDAGEGADRFASDGVYTGSYRLSPEQQPPLGQALPVGFQVTATNEAQESRSALGGFQYSHPAAALTGRYRDALVDGNLVISAEVLAHAPGRVHLAGVISSLAGQPLALAQAATILKEGLQWVELGVYGLILREAGAAGPYRLSEVSLTTTQGMPNALGPIEQDAYLTGSYRPAAFTDKVFARPDLLEAAARLQPETVR